MIVCSAIRPNVLVRGVPKEATLWRVSAVFQAVVTWLRQIVRVEEAALNPRSAERPPTLYEQARDAVLILDASASMQTRDWPPTRLEGAREAAKAFVRRLAHQEPEARVGVVAYGTSADTVHRLAPVSDHASIACATDRIHTLGGTSITTGLEAAARLLEPNGRPVQIVLLSDGHHNTGPKPEKIAERLKQRATIECVGIGGQPEDVDEKLLKWIASAYPDGRKRYRWIGDKEQLIKHFRDLGGGLTRR